MGKSVLFFEPNDNLKRRMQKRIRDWGMSSPNEEIVRAWTPMRSPFYRVHENGGSLEIIGGQEHGAGLARTAEIVLVDELRAFTIGLVAGDHRPDGEHIGGEGQINHRQF